MKSKMKAICCYICEETLGWVKEEDYKEMKIYCSHECSQMTPEMILKEKEIQILRLEQELDHYLNDLDNLSENDFKLHYGLNKEEFRSNLDTFGIEITRLNKQIYYLKNNIM